VLPTQPAAKIDTPGIRTIAVAAIAAVVLVTRVAHAQPAGPDPDPGDARFRAATAAIGRGDPAAALAGFLALADELPDSIWADDALAEAARLAERAHDRPRAIALLTRLADRYPTSRSAKWARAHAAELAATTAGAAWAEVEAVHDGVIAAVGRPGDPTPHLERLEAALRAHPGYPRGTAAKLWLGTAWGREGDWTRALAWYRDAARTATAPADRRAARLRAALAYIALDDYDAADAEVAAVAADPAADPIAIANARDDIAVGRFRRALRIAAWIALALLAAAAVVALHRARALRSLAIPPAEVWFLAPLAALAAIIAASGNPLIGTAVRRVAIGGVILTWISGAVLRAAPRPGRLRAIAHVAAIAVAAAAIIYLAVSTDRLIDLLLETWRTGPESGR
jgi:tetratricopeptide (TPR) repeat protein